MNKQLILPLLLLPYLVIAAQATDLAFSTNPAEAQARALREGKLYFVHFTATWCMPCQWMEKNTFANDTLAIFVNENYVPVKIDFDDSNASGYKQRYQVTSLPSLLIFNEKGELLDRYETSLSKDELLQALQKHLKPRPGRSGVAATRVSYTHPGKISRPALIPDEAKVAEKPHTTPDASMADASKTPELKPVATTQPIVVFAIQVGVFSDPANAERTRAQMEQRFSQPVQIVNDQPAGKKMYKVMVGKFEDKEEADRFLERLSAQSVQGFVKNMDN